MKKPPLTVSIIFFAFLIISSLVYFLKGNLQRKSPERGEIKVAVTTTAALVFIAKELGFFKEQGLNVELKSYPSGKQAATALLNDEVDISTTADAGFIKHSFDRKDIKILATVTAADLSEVIARKDRGIKEIADLKGKRIGVTKNSTGEFFLGTFLTLNNLSFEDIEVADLRPKEIVKAMLQGEIDGCHIWQPYVLKIKKGLETNYVSWPGQSGQDYYFVLLSKQQWLGSHRSDTELFIKALIKAEFFAKKNNSKAKTFYSSISGLRAEALDAKWSGMDLTVSLPQALLIVLEGQARWNIEKERTKAKEVPNYLEYIYFDALENVRPQAVTIIK